jgi:hypothetical protein
MWGGVWRYEQTEHQPTTNKMEKGGIEFLFVVLN